MNELNLCLHHFGLSVPNLDQTVAWYVDKLGFERDYSYDIDVPGHLRARVAFLRLGDCRVELFEVEGAGAMPESARTPTSDLHVHGLKHISFAVQDVQATRAALKARGWSSSRPSRPRTANTASASPSCATTTASISSSTSRMCRKTGQSAHARPGAAQTTRGNP